MNTPILRKEHDKFDGLIVEVGHNMESDCSSVYNHDSLLSSETTAHLSVSENGQSTSSKESNFADHCNNERNESISSANNNRGNSSSSSDGGGGGCVDDDDDDTKSSSERSSVQSVSSTLWSLLSNVLFLIGSVLSVCIACWDVARDEDDSFDDDDSLDDDDMGTKKVWTRYHTLSAMSSLMLIGNSIVDVIWSLRDARYNHGRRRHVWQIAAAVAFGMASGSDLVSVFLSTNEDLDPAYTAETISVHLFLLNGVLAIVSEEQSCAYLSDALTSCGDCLFLIASIIDLVLNYIGYPSASDGTWDAVDIANLVTSLLWLVDAILYIVSDILEIREYYNDDISECSSVEESSPDEYILLLDDSFEVAP